MSKKAEQAAFAAYPKSMMPFFPGSHKSRDRNSENRNAFIKGYEQAEKNLALTWKDMKQLDEIMSKVEDENYQAERRGENIPYDSDEHFYGEVLRRFIEQKK